MTSRRPPTARAALPAALPAALLAAALLAGCSGSGKPSSPGTAPGPASASSAASTSASTSPASPAASAAGSAPTASSGLADASADEILAASRQAFLGASSVHAKGVVLSSGTSYRPDLRLVKGRGAVGTIGSSTGTITVVRVGDAAYVALDAAALKSATGSDAAARQYAGKYFKVSASNRASFGPFLALTDPAQTFGGSLAPAGTVTKGAVSTLNGHQVIELLVDGGRTGTVDVALDGPPYPVRIGYGAAGQHVDFDSYGAKVTVQAPPGSQLVPGPQQ